jgi:hypothetical protein
MAAVTLAMGAGKGMVEGTSRPRNGGLTRSVHEIDTVDRT